MDAVSFGVIPKRANTMIMAPNNMTATTFLALGLRIFSNTSIPPNLMSLLHSSFSSRFSRRFVERKKCFGKFKE